MKYKFKNMSETDRKSVIDIYNYYIETMPLT